MPAELLLPLLMRWLHILSAVVVVGGTLFVYLVLRPAATATLQEDDHARLRQNIRKRWQHYVHAAILLFLISGFYNYLVVTRPLHVDQPLYHALFGIKFLLALAVFFLALALSSSRAWSERMRSSKTWMSALVLLSVLIVLVSGFLRTMPRNTAPAATVTVSEQTE